MPPDRLQVYFKQMRTSSKRIYNWSCTLYVYGHLGSPHSSSVIHHETENAYHDDVHMLSEHVACVTVPETK